MSQSSTVHDGPIAPSHARDDKHPAPSNGAGETAAEPQAKKRSLRAIALVAIALGVVAVGGWYVAHAGLESTDDAQVEADVVAVPALTGGAVIRVNFVENQVVKAGDILVEIDPAPATARLAQADADLASARAAADAAEAQMVIVDATAHGQKSVAEASLQNAAVGATTSGDEIQQADAQVAAATASLAQARSDLERVKSLFASGALPKHELDSAQTTFDTADANMKQAKARQSFVNSSRSQAYARIQEAKARLGEASAVEPQIAEARARAAQAKARVDTAKAARDLAALELSYTKVAAPRDGTASRKTVEAGQMLVMGQPVAQIVPLNDVWITANFKETQLEKMHAGQPATVSVDAYPTATFTGEVESFSGATGARFSLLPPENATGNFTKVVQRVPVRIKLAAARVDGKPLRPGMSADVTVDTRR